MITQFLLDGVTGLLSAIFALLPSASLSALFVTVDSTATSIGQAVAPWNTYLPLSEVVGMIALLLATWLPALLGYKVANWVWRHFPQIGGFGPGAG
jgi:hypothetical protein